jgi:RNA 2',3'-cyclic 3'-phosphodiesterase
MLHDPLLRHRLFFAIRPPLVLARRMAEASSWFGSQAKPLRPEHLHMTLVIFEDFPVFPERLAAMLAELGASIAADPFPIVLDQSAGSTRSIALRPRRKNAALQALHQAIDVAVTRAGLDQRRDYRFNPHLTLAYREGQPFTRSVEPFGWKVDEFFLVHSLVGQTRHELLGRWRLQGARADQFSLL